MVQQLNEEITPEEIANITGYQPPQEEELLDPEDFLEEEDLTQNPLVRGGFIGTFVFVIISLGVFVWWIFAATNSLRSKVPDLEAEEVAVVEDSEELSHLKAELALRDQQLPESPPPQKQIEKIEPQPQKVVPKPKPKLTPVVRQQSSQPIVRPKPLTQKTTTLKKVDPQKRWQELSQIGSFKSEDKAQPLPLQVQPQVTAQQNLSAANNVMVSNETSLPPQKAIAILESGITLPTRTINSQKLTVPIVLSEPLRDRSDQQVVPVGAVIIAEVNSNGSVMEIIPKTLSYEQDDQYYELNLDQGSVIVTGNQGPIIAQTETVGENGEGLSLTQIGQLAALTGGLAGVEEARDVALIFSALGMGRRNYSRTNTVQLYTVAQGTEVIVRIVKNLPFSLPSQKSRNSILATPMKTAYQPPKEEFDFEHDYGNSFQSEEELNFEGVESHYQQQELNFDD